MGVIYRNGMPYGGATSTYSPTGTMAVNGIAVSQAISQLSNGIRFKGSFNASTGAIDGGSTTLTSVEEKIGDMYTCDTAGTYLSVAYEVGDSIIFKNNVAATIAPVATDLISVEKTVSVTQTLTSGTKIGTVEGVDLYCQTNTDTKVTATKTNPTSQTSYYPTWYSSAAGGTGGVGVNDGFVYSTKEGTTSADGMGQIFLGNGVASGTAGNKKGYLRIYNNSTGYALLSYVDNSTSQVQQTFPATAGTILNTGTTSFTQTLTSGTEIGKLKINNVETTLYAQDNTKLPLAGGTMSGDITMNGNTIHFGSESSGAFVQYNNNVLNIGNQSGRILFSDGDIQITTPGTQNFIFEPGANDANFQIKSDLRVSGITWCDKYYGYSSGSPSVEIRATSSATPYIKIDTSSITITAPTWSTGSGTAAYITGTSGANKIVKYSSSRRYKENIDYEIDKEKYHEDLLKFKPCRFNYKTEPGLTNLGLIAEDVEEINPELCNFEGDKVESFKDRDLLVMCILELQRKDKEINELKFRLESLETRYNVEF